MARRWAALQAVAWTRTANEAMRMALARAQEKPDGVSPLVAAALAA